MVHVNLDNVNNTPNESPKCEPAFWLRSRGQMIYASLFNFYLNPATLNTLISCHLKKYMYLWHPDLVSTHIINFVLDTVTWAWLTSHMVRFVSFVYLNSCNWHNLPSFGLVKMYSSYLYVVLSGLQYQSLIPGLPLNKLYTLAGGGEMRVISRNFRSQFLSFELWNCRSWYHEFNLLIVK